MSHEHQTTRFTAAVRKLLSIKGEAPEPSFGVHIEDERPEFSFVKGERLWSQQQSVTSGAGTICIVGVRNPVNSGMLVVIKRVTFGVGTAATFRLGILIPPSALVGSSMFALDTRWGNQATTAQTIASGALAGYGAHIVTEMAAAVKPSYVDILTEDVRCPAIVLAPGTEAAVFSAGVAANTLDCFFAGYERPLESGELFA